MAGDSAREFARRQREKAARLERSADMWERGARGEAATASALQALAGPSWSIFHDVRWPGRQRANIDHIVVGPTGVFVIDSKNWSGDVRVLGDVLYQGSRRREREVAATADAALAVTQLLQGLTATPVLCFVRSEPIEGRARDVMICSTHNIAARLAAQRPILGPESIRRVTTILQWQLSSAVGPPSVPARRNRAFVPKGARGAPAAPRPPAARSAVRRVLVAGFGIVLALVGLSMAVGLVGAVNSIGEGAGPGSEAHGSSAPMFGDVVRLPASATHPSLRIKADKVMRVAARADYPMQRNQHLVAVRYSIQNAGAELWGAAPPYLRFSALASNGQNAAGANYSDLPPNRLMPAAFNLGPGKARRGFVVFTVPDGAKLVRVSAHTGFGSSDSVEWLIP